MSNVVWTNFARGSRRTAEQATIKGRHVMVNRGFDTELERLFAESAPAAVDADRFAARVTARLDRSWTYRRILIGGLGGVGGLIGGAQFLSSGLLSQFAAGLAQTDVAVSRFNLVRGATGSALRGLNDAVAAGSPFDARLLMMSAALAVVAGGLFFTRTIREF
jgi:hypothetical protein